ncbi:MAG: FtsX-like permease family protein [Chloroherpetonaceae bacterium]|nr:FtsX-like permease family protein [Chloroherpetonaceae bacterium]
MTTKDLFQFSFKNLRRAKLRTFLTVLGVSIGAAALSAMLSYGTGVQKTFTDEFSDLELFNTVRITPSNSDLNALLTFSRKTVKSTAKGKRDENQMVLTQKVFRDIQSSVQSRFPKTIVYPEVIFPSKIAIDSLQTVVMAEALPAAIGSLAGFRDIRIGKFFNSDSSNEVVISEILLNRMGFKNSDSIIGKKVKVVTVSMDFNKAAAYAAVPFNYALGLPLIENTIEFTIGGVMSDDIQKLSSGFRMILPIKTSNKVSRLNFLSTVDLLRGIEQTDGYQAIIVRTSSTDEADEVKAFLAEKGYNAVSFLDQFNELKKLFLVFDMALALVGTIGLIVATLGIMNTMIMSIMERYREIGIMKAVGASDRDIRKIFFVESGIIGFLGGIVGLALGYFVTQLITLAANVYIVSKAGTELSFFYFPWWLGVLCILFSILISLLAGFYPANRAAKIDPIEALRFN